LLALDSLLVVAEDARVQLGAGEVEIGVVMDARMDEAYAGRYRHDGAGWHTLQAPALFTLPALAAAWARAPDAVAGSGLVPFGNRLGLAQTSRRVAEERSRAAALLRLAGAAFAAGEAVDAAAALPLYLRDKVALTTAEREAAR
jgi:tRNA threonylcarbamoyladenosine biosynthesis protein TsaB